MTKYTPLNQVDDEDAFERVLRDEVRVYLNTRIPKPLKKELDLLTAQTDENLQTNVEELLRMALSTYYHVAEGRHPSVHEARRRLEKLLLEV